MRLAVRWLAGRQRANGTWDGGVPFFPTLYALSRIPGKEADAQFERAADRVLRAQNADGSWGRGQRSLCTFLTLSAMKNKGMDV